MALPFATPNQLDILEQILTKKIEDTVKNNGASIDIPTKVSQLENDTGYITDQALWNVVKVSTLDMYYTKKATDEKFATQEQVNTSLTNYTTKIELAEEVNKLNANIPDITNLATTTQLEEVKADIPTDYVTNTQLNSVEAKIPTDYLTQESLTNYALKSEIPDVSNFATITEIEAVASNIPSIEGLATEAQVNAVAANIPADYIPNSQLNTLATKEELETKQNKIVEVSGTFSTDGSGERKLTGEFTDTEGGQSLALNFYNLGAPTFINFNFMSYTKKIYTAEELYAWFGATDVISLRGAVSRNNVFILAFGITSPSMGYMQYRIPVQYIEVSTDTLPKIVLKAYGPDYSNDKLCQYIITANTDGTTFGDTGCNIQVEKITIQS